MERLTDKQEKFVLNLINGMSQREAYKNSYDAENMKDETIDSKASELFKKGTIRERYEELKQKRENAYIMTAIERMKLLTDIANGDMKERDKVVTPSGQVVDVEKDSNLSTRMKALDMLNKMEGNYVQKIQADVNADVDINIELTDEE